MISTSLPDEAYQLAAEYQLGAPIRAYGTDKREQIKSLAWMIVAVSLLFMIPVFIQTGFRSSVIDLIIYGVYILAIVVCALIFLIAILRAPNMTVYICESGFIVFTPSSSEAVRWESIARVDRKGTHEPYVVSLIDTNKADIILSKHVSDLDKLAEEIELKTQLARSSEYDVDLERQVERSKNEQAERQQAAKALYQDQKQYLATKDPDEAQTLGAEYRLGAPLGTYRSGFRSLPQTATLKHFAWVFLIVLLPVLDLQNGIPSFWSIRGLISMALFTLFFIIPRIVSRNIRLHIYTEGFICIYSSSLDIIRWEQIEKAVYAPHFFTFFNNFCTFHLKNGEKMALSDFLEKQDAIKQVLDPIIAKKEVYPFKKVKDVYIDVGRLAD